MKIAALSASAIIVTFIGAMLSPSAAGWSPPLPQTKTELREELLPLLPPGPARRQENLRLPIARNDHSHGAQQTQAATKTPVKTPPTTGTPTRQFKRAPFFKPPVRPVNVKQLKLRRFDPSLLVTLFEPEETDKVSARTFNLRAQPAHFLILELVLQVDREELRPTVELAEAALADHLTSYLATRTIQDVHKISELLRLKAIILLFLNDYLPAGGVREVYFSTYLPR